MVVDIEFNKVDEAIEVMREVSRWGKERSLRIWPEEWLTRDELITEDARPQDFCIGLVDDMVACAFILQQKDTEYWSDVKENEAVYLHKLCIRREFSHMNMSTHVMNAIKRYCKTKGIKYIRLDTAIDEDIVKRIYLDMGFTIIKTFSYHNGRGMALYQLEV